MFTVSENFRPSFFFFFAFLFLILCIYSLLIDRTLIDTRKEVSKSPKGINEVKQQLIKQDTVLMCNKANKSFTSEICEVSNGKLKTKKKAFPLSQCYVTVDTTKLDVWIIMEIDSKEVSYIKCKNIKEVEEWLSTCVVNGAFSSYFS